MKLRELAKTAGLTVTGEGDPDITGLALDSRQVQPEFLFAALPGTQMHGRNFVKYAQQAGAVAVLSDGPTDADLPHILAEDAARALAKLARCFYPGQPEILVAITGTNGKSSSVEFLRQIWMADDKPAAAIGTLGVTSANGLRTLGHTTPDAIRLHKALDELSTDGVTHCAFEASSHGLVQRRLNGARLSAAGFTNLTQDHFDYHESFADYFAAKKRLFFDLLPAGKPTVINVDDDHGRALAEELANHGRNIQVGWTGRDVKLLEIQPTLTGQVMKISFEGKIHEVHLPLVGEFQAQNALMAFALAIETGTDADTAFRAMENLQGVRGRMETAATTHAGVPVLVDFAHTPDGLEKLLRSVRPHTRGKVHLVFGCGGNRDPKKRPIMGAVAQKLADRVIVTDDNPRAEIPADIRAAVMSRCPKADEIADRRFAIATAIENAQAGDVILIAGKGHEQGQIIGDVVHPFDDAKIARELVA